MRAERHFLGWDEPVTVKVRRFLLPEKPTKPVDLSSVLVVVPTRQAGRRLRESLALYCEACQTALFPPTVETTTFFLRQDHSPGNLAGEILVRAVWAEVFLQADTRTLPGLFPAQPPRQDVNWAIRTGELVSRLRETLAEGACRIADVTSRSGGLTEEPERWKDLARLEEAYLSRLEALGYRDPCIHKIEQAHLPVLPASVRRIVLAAVPDPTSLVVKALESMPSDLPIDVLVHAPEEHEAAFDPWGIPRSSRWSEVPIEIPDPPNNVRLAGSPPSQCREVLAALAGDTGRHGPADVAIGVPDRSLVPFLKNALQGVGLDAFDPGGRSLAEHPLVHLLAALSTLGVEGTYAAFSDVLRHADLLSMLERDHQLLACTVLEQLDLFQNQFMPPSFKDLAAICAAAAGDPDSGYAELIRAVEVVVRLMEPLESQALPDVVSAWLSTVYDGKTLVHGRPEDDDFIMVAGEINRALEECRGGWIDRVNIQQRELFRVFLDRLKRKNYYSDHEVSDLDLEGWLELPWNDAPFLLVTGMNDGLVPEGRISDVFLPDSLRRALGLRCDEDRLARDAYLMQALIASRRQTGRVCFIAGRTNARGDPLKPSRLLFRCADPDLADRTERLFGIPEERRPDFPASASFLLDASPPPDLDPEALEIRKMSVTAFSRYLACPFCFYLRSVLGMQGLDDQKTELDALDYGSMIHYALQRMAEDKEINGSDDASVIAAFLENEVTGWIRRHYGPSPSLPLLVQLESARQRLRAAAGVQAGLVAAGWEIIGSEVKLEGDLNGMSIRGKIDRIDRHRENGRIRILDYKTSDRGPSPGEVHLGGSSDSTPSYAVVEVKGRSRGWIDLQLPLYRLLPSDCVPVSEPVDLGFFNLPRAANETGVNIWEDVNEELINSAARCAEGVIRDIRACRFWPPAARLTDRELEPLFPGGITGTVDVEILLKQLEARTAGFAGTEPERNPSG